MLTFLQGLGVLTAVPFIYLMIPRFGVRGAAAALMLATLCRFLFVMLNYPFRLKVRPPNLLISWNEIITLIRTRQHGSAHPGYLDRSVIADRSGCPRDCPIRTG